MYWINVNNIMENAQFNLSAEYYTNNTEPDRPCVNRPLYFK